MHAENNNHVNETIYASYKADNTIVIVDISEKISLPLQIY